MSGAQRSLKESLDFPVSSLCLFKKARAPNRTPLPFNLMELCTQFSLVIRQMASLAPWIAAMSCILVVGAHMAVEIDNGVIGEPEVQCGSDSISLLFNSRNPFTGKVFVKGYVADGECVMMGDSKTSHRFTVKHDSCGVRRQREVNGVVIITTVIVSFHSIFITRVDRAYRLSCFYVEGAKRVQQQLDVASLTTQAVEGQTQLPVCRYEILSDGPNGVPIKYGKIGETVYHKWTCVSELTDVYCMRVHSCTVYDGQGGPPVTVLDANGCSVDGVILQNLDYTSDLTAGKAAQVFKFADKAGLYFNCQIQLTIKDKQYGCSTAQPQCTQTYVTSSAQTTEVSSEYTGSHESGYPTRPADDGYNGGSSDYYASTGPPGYESEQMHYPQPPALKLAPNGKGPTSARPAGAPGIRPTYSDLHPNETEEGYSTMSASSYESSQNPYTRLIKRNVNGAAMRNRTQPITVADFDLPERGLIVFGLEDGNNEEQENESAARLIHQDRASQTCFTSNKFLVFAVMCLVLFIGLIFSLSLIIYKQRRLMDQPYMKH
ncbi:unnamed protein product [Cylicocyclus nassatus]|uniref:ZP domain-containing protein n=1 Tax=Cylicocyclus nassatus TaxID=53992 RepID=A0AA36H9W6_CYLNA|nr:unnamed protein product [Cylicocyclus nassatus]